MMEFIDLQNIGENQSLNIIPQDELQSIVINPQQQEEYKEPSEGCVQEQCRIDIGCGEYFAVKNLFSELTDDWQRSIIRQNLGIADTNSLIWGKIQGNLVNQQDLVKFIADKAGEGSEAILEQVNLKLKYWSQSIENKIESLASNITSLELIPQYAIPDQLPIDLLVTWEYDQPVQAQAINNIVLDPNQRSYIFTNIADNHPVRLSYFYNGVWLARNVNFEVTFPTYYGLSANYQDNSYTTSNKFKVTPLENQYIYVMSKNDVDLSVNGIIGGFEVVGYTNISQSRYIIYKSINPNLGETIVRIHDK